VREQLAEALVLAGIAGIAGSALGWMLLRVTIAFAAGQVPRLDEASVDTRVLLIAAGAALLTALVCGPVVAWRVAQTNPGDALRGAGRGIAASHRAQWWLAGSQAALAVVLLAGSGLLVRSLIHIQRVNPGFVAEGAVLLPVDRNWIGKGKDETPVFWRQLLARLNGMPGVKAGAVGDFFIKLNPDYAVTVEGRETVYNEQVTGDFVTPGFFEAAGVRLLSGRSFAPEDFDGGSLRLAIVNQTMARRLWAGENAVGKRLQFGPADPKEPWITVVGVVEDMRRLGLERSPICEMFGPGFGRAMDLVVRATPPRDSLIAEVRAAIKQVDSAVPVHNVVRLQGLLGESALSRKLQTGLLASFAALTLLLAAVGLHGTLQQAMLDRRREFGIRMALGAEPSGVWRLVIGRGLVVAGAGSAVGALAAFWLSRMLEALLFEVKADDPWALAFAPIMMVLTALLAGLAPAWQASRVDPARVLEG
jgi:predicted permease